MSKNNGKQFIVLENKIKNITQLQAICDEICPDKNINMQARFDNAIKTLDYYTNGKKLRKNGVLAIHLLMKCYKARPDSIDTKRWGNVNKQWLIRRYFTTKETTLLYYYEESDKELTLNTIFVPVDTSGKINASFYFGGRSDYAEMQKSYSDEMKKMFGLSRLPAGMIRNKIKTGIYYDTDNILDENPIPVQDENESEAEYIDRLKTYINELKLSYQEKLSYKDKNERIEKDTVTEPDTDNQGSESGPGIPPEQQKYVTEYMGLLSRYGNYQTLSNMLGTSQKLQYGIKAYQSAGHPEIVGQVQKILNYGQQYMEQAGIN